jgi:hypothetical protein
MGTTLTGTTPQDTYDSLIKVTDNGPLSGSLKKLTDGLGNDSALSLSTGAASIAGTLAVTGNATFDTNTLFVDAANNRVGIGTIAPETSLQISGVATSDPATAGAATSGYFSISSASQPTLSIGVNASNTFWLSNVNRTFGGSFYNISLNPLGGNVGVRKIDPAVPLDVTGNIRTSTGILFGSDTAAANALDDYEEGTFTPNAFGDTTIGSTTYDSQFGYYTKIGRQVNITMFLGWTALTGTGSLRIGGLPFTSGNLTQYFAVGSCNTSNLNWTGGSFVSALVIPNTSTIAIYGSTDDAGSTEQLCVNEQANVRITVTYYV